MLEIELPIPTEHATYPHHFPNKVIVPGYLLLEWVVERLQNQKRKVANLKSCKFIQPVYPGDLLVLIIKYQDGARAKIVLTRDGEECLRADFGVTVVCD